MFARKDILDFINKIINKVDKTNKDETINNIKQFKDYLKLTKMVSSSDLEYLNKIMDCLDEIITLKIKLGNNIKVQDIVKDSEKENDNKEEKVKVKKREIVTPPPVVERHYNHYGYSSSSSCSSGERYSSSC